jgi:hypothetical protein
MEPPALCSEKKRLLSRHDNDLARYIQVSEDLLRRTGEEFRGVYKRAEAARELFEQSSRLLREHVIQHGC